MLGSVCEGKIGAIFSIEASRLARTGREWHTLLEFCGVVGVLLIDADGIYDPRQINDRLVLGMKGTISEMEVATFRQRAQSALEQKAKRGELFRRVAIGYVRSGNDRIEKDPDERVRSAINLVFSKFTELASARRLYRWLCQQQIQLPTAVTGAGISRTISWSTPRYHSLPGSWDGQRSMSSRSDPYRLNNSPRLAFCSSADCARCRNVATSISLIVPFIPNTSLSLICLGS